MQSTLVSGNKSESAVEGRAKRSRGHGSLTMMIIMTRHEAFPNGTIRDAYGTRLRDASDATS